jgi:hypothetical protein
MVEATQAYHKVLRTIDALMRYYAIQEAKEQIRARNQRVTDFEPKDISIMARELLHTKPEVFLERAKASSVVRELEAKLAVQAARKLARKSRVTSNSEVRMLQALPVRKLMLRMEQRNDCQSLRSGEYRRADVGGATGSTEGGRSDAAVQ